MKEESLSILSKAYHSGIKILDTAEAYGNAIELIGQYHTDHSPFGIISKFSSLKENDRLITKVKESLAKLHISSFYGYLLHSPGDMVYIAKDTTQAHHLREIKSNGWVKKIGVSIYTNADFKTAIENPLIEIIQLPFNVLDNNNKRSELMKLARDTGKEIHCRSVFLQGLLYKKLSELPAKLMPLAPYLTHVNAIAKEAKLSPAQLSLAYSLHNPLIDKILIGVDSVKQLELNIEMARLDLSEESKTKIDELINVTEEELLYPYNWN